METEMNGLFTVLIAAKEHIDAIQRDNALFFEPFLGRKDMVFCTWNPRGQSLSEAVPGLLDAVGRRKEWRAVILNSDCDEQLCKQNPFDVAAYDALSAIPQPSAQPESGEDWDSWEASWKAYYQAITPVKEQIYREALTHPLQKLATWLCFQPSPFALEETNAEETEKWSQTASDDEDIKPNARLESLEREQYRRELRMKELLRREFSGGRSLNIAYPSAVYCISERLTEAGFFNLDPFWHIRTDSDYSQFADRNLYFDKMRFLVFDLLPRTHRNSRCDCIRFLYTVLVFASNQVPGSAMKARRLYVLESENDDTPLCTMATSYAKKLTATCDAIEAEMEQIRSEMPGELSDKDAAALFCTPAEIAVTLDEGVDPDRLFAEADYGLSSDCPTDEKRKWEQDYRVSRNELTAIGKQQRRVARKSVDKFRLYSQVPTADISRMTSFQLDDVREYTDAAEDEMITSVPRDPNSFSHYAEVMQEQNRQVRKVLQSRMTKGTTIALSAICLGVYLLCLLPMLWHNTGRAEARTAAVLLTVSAVVVLAVVLLITLFHLRSQVLDAIGSFNSAMSGIWDDISAAMQSLSDYLSAACNVCRGHRVLNYFNRNVDSYTQKLRIRKKHQEDVKKLRACLLEYYSDFIGGAEYYDDAMIQPYDYDFDQKVEYAYPAPFLAGDTRQIPFMESGNLITVPSSYVTRISVRMEDVYDA